MIDNPRSANMRANKSADTSPELRVRHALHALGVRYRLHVKTLPGTPDIVLPSRRAAVRVMGCYWHQHEGCKLASVPAKAKDYWQPKFARTKARDAENEAALAAAGWRVITLWECDTRDATKLDAATRVIADLPQGIRPMPGRNSKAL